jgi:hypothetical protein
VIGSVDLLKAFQSRAARMAVGASTVRGQRVSGIVEAARAHLRDLPLEEFSVTQRTAFDGELDARTQQLKAALPAGARRWGLARKVLNIFLRDCVYSVHLRDAHGLGGIEDFLELPLDRVTADALCMADARVACIRTPPRTSPRRMELHAFTWTPSGGPWAGTRRLPQARPSVTD